jgi:LPS sulfotransferase NodH
MIKGQWEILDSQRVAGWVLDTERPEDALSVHVTINGTRLEPTSADIRRPDLEAQFGAGGHGFSLGVAEALRPGFNTTLVTVPGTDFMFERPERDFFHTPQDGAFGRRLRSDPQIFLYDSQFKRDIEGDIPLKCKQGSKLLTEMAGSTKIIFILFTNRSGSNLITDMLKTLGVGGGVTHEPFLSDVVRNQIKKHNYTSLQHYIASTIQTYRRNGAVFFKIGWDALSFLSSAGVFGEWLHRSHFIWTRRHDKIMQAISYVKALRSGVFFDVGASGPNSPPSFMSLWNGEETLWAIAKMHRHMHEADTRLGFFLELMNVPALEIWYEDLADNMDGNFTRIRKYIENEVGITTCSGAFNARLRKHASVDSQQIKDLLLQLVRLPVD